MKATRLIAAVTLCQFLAAVAGLPNLLVPDAQAFRGRGAAFAVGAAAGSASTSTAEAEAAAAQQQAAAAQQQAAAAQKQAAEAEQQLAAEKAKNAAAQPPTAPAAAQAVTSAAPLPLGKVVPALPAGCTSTPVGGVNYYYCGGNFYKAVYEGSTLKYVTTKPE
jgi:type II secretory pathway pseudopilin PulG